MFVATLTERGQIVIPIEIRARYGLTPGRQIEIVDAGGTIRLLVRRQIAPSDPAAGYGMVTVKSGQSGSRQLLEFHPADALRGQRKRSR